MSILKRSAVSWAGWDCEISPYDERLAIGTVKASERVELAFDHDFLLHHPWCDHDFLSHHLCAENIKLQLLKTFSNVKIVGS